MNNRGFVGDILTILITGFGLAIVLVVLGVVLYSFNTAIQSTSVDAGAKSHLAGAESRYPESMDVLLACFVIGVPLLAGAFAFFLDVSAIFFWLLIGVSFFFVLVGAVFGNAWYAFASSGSLVASVVGRMPVTGWVFEHYALYALLVTVIIVGGLFFRMRRTV